MKEREVNPVVVRSAHGHDYNAVITNGLCKLSPLEETTHMLA